MDEEEDEKRQQLVGARAPLHCAPDIIAPKVRYFGTKLYTSKLRSGSSMSAPVLRSTVSV